MNRSASRLCAAAAALALLTQATGAADLPAALVHPPGAFPPPAARLAAVPARPAPAASPSSSGPGALARWLESARIVADYFLAAPETPAAAAPRPEPVAQAEPAPAASEAPPADRMLIRMAPGESVEAVLSAGRDFSSRPASAVSRPFPTAAAHSEPWVGRGGLRGQVTYARPHGVVIGRPDGFHAVFADGSRHFAPEAEMPRALQREFAVYFHGEQIEVSMELVNKTGRALTDVRLEAVQETFRPVGTEGRRLAPPAELLVARELAPGAKAVARWVVSLGTDGAEAVNLEQTHVRVTAAGQAAALIDEPQAGVIDPPGPALLK